VLLLALLTGVALLATTDSVEVGLVLVIVGGIGLVAVIRWKPSRRRAGVKPFRSPVLGAALKFLGLAIIITVFLANQTEAANAIWSHHSGAAVKLNWLLYALGTGLIFRGYQMSVRSFDPGDHPDKRPPVLYLRGFDTDGRMSLQPNTLLAWLYGVKPSWGKKGQADVWQEKRVLFAFNPFRIMRMLFNRGAESAAEVLAQGFSRCGPLVAIGRPGDTLALPGADQMFVADERWQQVVLDYLERSQAVILVPANGAGVRWEIDQVFARVPRQRILLYLSAFHGRPDEYAEFRARLRAEHGVELPDGVPETKHSCFVYFEPDGSARLQKVCLRSPLLWPITGSAVDTRRTFRSFISGLAGGERPAPALPRAYPMHEPASLLVAAALAATFVLLPTLWAYRHELMGDMTWTGRYAAKSERMLPSAPVKVVPKLPGPEPEREPAPNNRIPQAPPSAGPPPEPLTPQEVLRAPPRPPEPPPQKPSRQGPPSPKTSPPEPPPEIARLAREAWAGKPVRYEGKAMRYTLSAPPVWAAEPIDQNPEMKRVMEESKKAGIQATLPEHFLALAGGKLARVSAEVQEEEWPPDLIDEVADKQLKLQSQGLQSMLPDLKIREIGRWRFEAGGRAWGEYEWRVDSPVPEIGFTIISRFTSYRGQTLVLGANIMRDDPLVRKLALEVLDTATVIRTSLPGADQSWTGKTIIPTRPGVLGHVRPPVKGQGFAPLSNNSYVVLADEAGWLRVRDEAKEVWFDKDDAVTSDRAVAHFTAETLANPEAPDAYFGRAAAWSLQHEPEKAIADYTEVIKRQPRTVNAYYNRGQLWRQQRQYKKALADFDEAIRLSPDDPDLFARRGNCRYLLSQFDRAAADFDEAIRLGRRQAGIFNNRGMAREKQRHLDQAAADYTEAIRLDPKYVPAWRNRGQLNFTRGRYIDAVNDYSEALKLEPNDADTYNSRGLVYAKMTAYDEAKADYNEAIKLDPEHTEALYNRVWANRKTGNQDAAMKDMDELARLKSEGTRKPKRNISQALENSTQPTRGR
jgi:tetratricopeptide (TPR) repeat protein